MPYMVTFTINIPYMDPMGYIQWTSRILHDIEPRKLRVAKPSVLTIRPEHVIYICYVKLHIDVN